MKKNKKPPYIIENEDLETIQYTNVPFDVQCSLSDSLLDFGILGNGKYIGEYAIFRGPVLTDHETGDKLKLAGKAGLVVGHLFGRIIIDSDQGFLGWLNPDEFEIIDRSRIHRFETVTYIH